MEIQGRNRRENLVATSAMVGRICPPPAGDRVKVSENLGATAVARGRNGRSCGYIPAKSLPFAMFANIILRKHIMKCLW